MFHSIPDPIQQRMRELEAHDAQDRQDGTERAKRLRQVPPDTGKFIALMAASAPAGRWIEIGTSGGYSAMWLSLACEQIGKRLQTFELLDNKAAIARNTFKSAQIEHLIDFVHGDALEHLPKIHDVAFCFLDAEKELYVDCFNLVVPNLVPGGILLADNAISHSEDLQEMLSLAEADPRVDVVLVPIGSGVLLCRKV